jgi:glyoxylase-like metal-dependent hydrolase (beta-lactamase superfamily II)
MTGGLGGIELPPGYEPPSGLFDQWREVAPGVLVRRHRELDLNVTLVLGDASALVVDTTSHAGSAGALVGAIRSVTALPWVVVNTHAHFDHCFGNATFASEQRDVPIWGHAGCRETLLGSGERQRELGAGWLRDGGRPEEAEAVARVRVLPPHLTFTGETVLDLGGREVLLQHPGRGHTDHDAIVQVPDAGVTVAGDLVEEGAPPAFSDAYPLDWPATLTGLLPRLGHVVVPGHGDVVDPAFVAAQRDDLAKVADAARTLPAGADDLTLTRAAVRLPVGRAAGLEALRRHRELTSSASVPTARAVPGQPGGR